MFPLACLLHNRAEGDETADEAIDTLDFYHSSFDKDITDETKAKTGGRNLHVVADDEETTKSSRVHAIVVDDVRKRVDVVFRGTTSLKDWRTNLAALFKVGLSMDRSLVHMMLKNYTHFLFVLYFGTDIETRGKPGN
jgi:hypothetical protein